MTERQLQKFDGLNLWYFWSIQFKSLLIQNTACCLACILKLGFVQENMYNRGMLLLKVWKTAERSQKQKEAMQIIFLKELFF